MKRFAKWMLTLGSVALAGSLANAQTVAPGSPQEVSSSGLAVWISFRDGQQSDPAGPGKVKELPAVVPVRAKEPAADVVVPTSSCAPESCAPSWPGEGTSVFAFGDFLYLAPRGVNVPFGQAFNGIGPTAVPRDGVGTTTPEYSVGVRAGVGVDVGEGGVFQLSGTWYDNRTNAQLGAPDGTIIHSFLTHPATLNASPDSLAADARYDVNFRLIDFDYTHCLCSGEKYSVDWLLGIRYAHLDQDLHTDFTILGSTTVDTAIRFDGLGPRVGLQGEYNCCGGLFCYGKGVLDVLAGHFGSSYVQQNVFAGLQAETTLGADRIVPQLELEVGVGWVGFKDHVRVMAGYYVGAWFNTVTTPGLIQSVQNTNFTTNGNNFRDTLTFDGFVARIEFRY